MNFRPLPRPTSTTREPGSEPIIIPSPDVTTRKVAPPPPTLGPEEFIKYLAQINPEADNLTVDKPIKLQRRLGSIVTEEALLTPTKKPTLKEKKHAWKLAFEMEGGYGSLPPQYRSNGIIEEGIATRTGKKAHHHRIENADRVDLETGIYKIDPLTSQSRWRNDHPTLEHVSRKIRKDIKNQERRHAIAVSKQKH